MNEQSVNALIPESVRQQAARSEEIVTALKDGQGKETTTAPASDPNTPANPEIPGARQEEGIPNGEQHQAQTPDNGEAKYLALKGKYDAEVPRLAKEVSDLRRQVTAMADENLKLTHALEEARAKDAAPDTGNQPGNTDAQRLNPDDFSEYGAEFVAMAERLNTLMDKNEQLTKQAAGKPQGENQHVEQPTEDPKYTAFMTGLRSGVADIDALNTDNRLLRWLDASGDPKTGRTMRQVLNDAEANLNVEGAVAVFNQFKKDILGIPLPNEADPQQDTGDPPPNPTLSPPSPSPPGASDIQPAGKIWRNSEIKKFYTDKAAGRYSKEEGARLDADIMKAAAEGRVIQG